MHRMVWAIFVILHTSAGDVKHMASGKQLMNCHSDVSNFSLHTATLKSVNPLDWFFPYNDFSSLADLGLFDVWLHALHNGEDPSGVLQNISSEAERCPIFTEGDNIGKMVKILDVSLYSQENYTSAHCHTFQKRECMSRLTESYAKSVLNLTDEVLRYPKSWRTQPKKMELANELQQIINNVALQAFDAGINLDIVGNHIAVKTETVSIKRNPEDFFYRCPMSGGTNITVPKLDMYRRSINGLWNVALVSYDNLHDIIGSENQTEQTDLPEGQPIYQMLISKVISIVQDPLVKTIPLSGHPIQVFFHNTFSLSDFIFANITCVFWDQDVQQWSSEGVRLIRAENEWTLCEYDDTRTMAVKADYTGVHGKIPLVITYITLVGCTISIVCLLFAITAFCMFRNMDDNCTIIVHRNLCIMLLCAQLSVVVGFRQTNPRALCKFFTVCVHYFYLSTFFWMLLEGYQVYRMIIMVFPRVHYKRWPFYVVGYGTPMIIVSISLGIKWNEYGAGLYCWLDPHSGLVWAFLGPAAAILMCNFIILILALKGAYKNSMNMSKARKKQRFHWVKGVASLGTILGLTWIFGFFVFDDEDPHFKLAMEIVFSILNSLQGLFIFVFHCLCQRKIQQAIAKKIPCLRHRLIKRDTISSRMSNNDSFKKTTRTTLEVNPEEESLNALEEGATAHYGPSHDNTNKVHFSMDLTHSSTEI